MSTPTIALMIVGMGLLAWADFSVKQSSGKISSSLGTLIYAFTATLVALAWTLWTQTHEGLNWTREGVLWSISTGIAFSLFTALLFILFSSGVNLSIGSPVVRMGGILLAATLGVIVFREGLNLKYLIGFILAVVGIYLVVTR